MSFFPATTYAFLVDTQRGLALPCYSKPSSYPVYHPWAVDLTRQMMISREALMRTYTAVIEKCSETGLYVGFVPGFPGAHSQGETLDELNKNLKEVIEMLLEDGKPKDEFLQHR